MESRSGGGEIPKRLRISKPKEITMDLPFSHCRHAAYVCQESLHKNREEAKREDDDGGRCRKEKSRMSLMAHKTKVVQHCVRTAS